MVSCYELEGLGFKLDILVLDIGLTPMGYGNRKLWIGYREMYLPINIWSFLHAIAPHGIYFLSKKDVIIIK